MAVAISSEGPDRRWCLVTGAPDPAVSLRAGSGEVEGAGVRDGLGFGGEALGARRGARLMASAVQKITGGSPVWKDMTADAQEIMTDALRDLARWLCWQLEREYDYLISDEAV